MAETSKRFERWSRKRHSAFVPSAASNPPAPSLLMLLWLSEETDQSGTNDGRPAILEAPGKLKASPDDVETIGGFDEVVDNLNVDLLGRHGIVSPKTALDVMGENPKNAEMFFPWVERDLSSARDQNLEQRSGCLDHGPLKIQQDPRTSSGQNVAVAQRPPGRHNTVRVLG